MSVLAGLLPLTALFGWPGLIGSLGFDLAFGAGLLAAGSLVIRMADGG